MGVPLPQDDHPAGAGGDADLERRRHRAREYAATAQSDRDRPEPTPAPITPIRPELGEGRPPRRRRGLLFALAALLLVAVGAGGGYAYFELGDEPGSTVVAAPASVTGPRPAASEPAVAVATRAANADPAGIPSARALDEATEYAAGRDGDVAFAALGSDGELVGEDMDRRFVSASVVKSLLLVAELRRLDREGLDLDPGTEGLLTSMITYSDNNAADSIYARVGDDGIAEVADLYGMKRLRTGGYWASTDITAGDMARMFGGLEGPIPAEHREFALGLLGSIIAEQSWGVPAAAAKTDADWQVRFKGGWRPTDSGELAHQAAELRDGERTISIAVLSDGMPTFDYATDTVEGVAARLLDEGGGEDPAAGRLAAAPPRRAGRARAPSPSAPRGEAGRAG